jgi:exopolyphosphatase/guanosine-5'-triphosphate,3'-diphosphate pyrophosphatase
LPFGSDAHIEDRRLHDEAVALGRHYRFDEPHALQVTRVALSLFDQLFQALRIDAADRRLLHAAALLHDIGIGVDEARHHKISLVLIAESRLTGFSSTDMLLTANVARYHRRSGPLLRHPAFAALHAGDRSRVLRLSALLRLADVLDRDHRQAIRRVRARLLEGRLRLELDGERIGLPDAAVLRRKAVLFERTFDRHVECRVSAAGGA